MVSYLLKLRFPTDDLYEHRFLYSECSGITEVFEDAKRELLDNLGVGFNADVIRKADALWISRIDKTERIDLEKETYQFKARRDTA